MRARYALIFGHGAGRHLLRRSALEQGLIVAAELPSLLLVTQEGTPILKGRMAAAIGRLITAAGRRPESLDPALEALALGDDPIALSRECWGNFVLFGSPDGEDVLAYRDPSGSIGAFRFCLQGLDAFASDAELAFELGLLADARPDLEFARHWLAYPFLKTSRSGIAGVCEVLAGTRHRRRTGGWASQLAWKPWYHAARAQGFTDASRAARDLRQLAVETIPAQVTAAPLLQLSGGLDSSIIAICLREAGRSFAAVHFATSSADGDERRYANSVAASCGTRLHLIHEGELKLGLPETVARSFVPGANPVLAPIERAILERMAASGAEVLLDGGGGDNLFCFLTTAAPVLDALRSGPSGAAVRAIMSLAEATHSSWWEVVRAAARLASRRGVAWKADPGLVGAGMSVPQMEGHPWLARDGRLLPGKREHLESLVQIQHFLDRRTDWSVPVLHPLMAQPLLEFCLTVPSFMWMAGGRDRAIARAAFDGLVPREILERRMKGSLQGYFRRTFARLLQAMRELLLGGVLAEERLIDPNAVDRAFRDRAEEDVVQLRLSEIAALECWLRSWRS